jgi:hypothetical protein
MALITAKSMALRGMTVLADGSRFETRGGNRPATDSMPALVSVRHLHLDCKQQSYGQPGLSDLSLGEPRFGGVQCRKPAKVAGGVVGSRRLQDAIATCWQRQAD